MIAVIFELIPKSTRAADYFQLAEELRPLLDDIDGFLSIERFESLTEPGKYLSLSFWENEQSVAEWRNTQNHRGAQTEGRRSIFEDYRLRVAHVLRDYGLTDRLEAPQDSRNAHDSDSF
ncbi:MAG: antibiotic biosynthesis monooxygenase [Pseudomonadota bacterium]